MTSTPLPLRSTRLFGRDDELRRIRELLSQSAIVTLTGAGGCGKTRLALEMARTHAGEVRWVDLAAVNDPDLVPHVVRSALGLPDRPGEDPTTWLIQSVQGRDVLIVLDNCEHLIDTCAALVSGLSGSGVTVLATSREPLGLESENVLRVPSLPDEDALALFSDRARAARPDVQLGESETAAIREICQRLDGIPLALELAAARMRMMTPRQIADELEDRFHLLTGGSRTAVPRQRTLEASVAWSHDLLSEDERVLLRCLSVFPGRFDLPGVREISGYGESSVDLLAGLIDKSLVDVDVEGAHAKYALLETVRVYAQQRLVEAGEAATVRDRHLAYFVRRAEEREIGMFGAELVTELARTDADLPDLRSAMDWGASSGNSVEALRIAGHLWMFWFLHTRPTEGRARLESLLVTTPNAPSLVRYKGLLAILMLCLSTDIRSARTYAQQAVELAEDIDDDRLRSQALAWRGQTGLQLGSTTDLTDLEESLRFARQTGDLGQISRSLQWLGTAMCLQGELSRGSALLDESIALARQTDNELQLGWALGWRSHAAAMAADHDGTYLFAQQSLEILARRGEYAFTATPLCDMALVATNAGRYDEAAQHCARAVDEGIASGSLMSHAIATLSGALVALFRGCPDESAFVEAERLFDRFGMPAYVGFAVAGQGVVAHLAGDLDRAQSRLDTALEMTLGYPFVRGRVLIPLSRLAFDRHRGQQALDLGRECLGLAQRSGDRACSVDALECIGEALWSRGDSQGAARVLGAADRLRQEINYVRFPLDERRYATLLGLAADLQGWDEGRLLSAEEVVAWLERSRGQRGRPTSGWESLTPTELEVAALVAQGLSNPEVATKLFVSRNTVKAHVAHVYAKLGISTRSELAAEVTRRLTQGKA